MWLIYSVEIYFKRSLARYREVPFTSNSPDMSLNWRKLKHLVKRYTNIWKKAKKKSPSWPWSGSNPWQFCFEETLPTSEPLYRLYYLTQRTKGYSGLNCVFHRCCFRQFCYWKITFNKSSNNKFHETAACACCIMWLQRIHSGQLVLYTDSTLHNGCLLLMLQQCSHLETTLFNYL